MWLYLVRHGDAFPSADWAGDDAARPLTEEGRAEVQAAARGLARLDLKAEAIFTSPRLRAEQTAHLIAEELRLPLSTRDILGAGFDVHGLATLLDEVASARGVMLVGHEPDLSELAGALCGGDGAPSRIHMRKAACCALKLPKAHDDAHSFHAGKLPGAATLEWLLSAPQLALIGAAPTREPSGEVTPESSESMQATGANPAQTTL